MTEIRVFPGESSGATKNIQFLFKYVTFTLLRIILVNGIEIEWNE